MLMAVFLVAVFLYANNDIGIFKRDLERNARYSQKIEQNWLVQKDVSDTMAAMIFYSEDKSDHTFSIYVNRPNLSFGYFFRGGGDITESEKYITEITVEGYNEKAFISMNYQKAEKLEIDDGNNVQTIEIDSNSPFAFVLDDNVGNITFYDVNGNTIETVERKL